MYVASVKRHTALSLAPLLPAVLLLLSCTQDTPVSPREVMHEPVSNQETGHGKIGLKIGNHARLVNGDVEVLVRARCPTGYVRQETGPLSVTQGSAYAEVDPPVQLGGCSGRWETVKAVARRFDPSEPAFHTGRALVSMTFAAENPNDPTGSDVLQVSVSRRVFIR